MRILAKVAMSVQLSCRTSFPPRGKGTLGDIAMVRTQIKTRLPFRLRGASPAPGAPQSLLHLEARPSRRPDQFLSTERKYGTPIQSVVVTWRQWLRLFVRKGRLSPDHLMPLPGHLTLPTWLREILVSVGIAARTITVFAAAVGFGILIAIEVGEGNPWIAASAAVGVLLFIVLLARLWWMSSRGR